MTESPAPAYLALKTDTAQKLGRTGGGITFKVLADPERQQLFLTIVGNDGGGYYSREVVAFDAVEACLPVDRAQPLAAKAFAPAFVGRSSNNPGFMAAILRAEGLLVGVEDKPHQHLVAGDWAAWRATLLALPGEPYAPPVKEVPAAGAPPEMTQQDIPGGEEQDDHPGRRKGRKNRDVQAAEEVGHARPA